MDLNQLEHFVKTAKHKSISKTAKELYISQQALSKSIKHLEESLGVKLFYRTAQGTELTQVGEKILPIAATTLSQLDFYSNTIQDIADAEKNSITIAFEHPYMPYAIPAKLSALQTGILVRSIVASGLDNCIETVLKHRADVGFCSYTEELRGLHYQSVITEPVQFLMNANHRLANRSELELKDLRNAAHVLPLGDVSLLSAYINECLIEGFYPNFVFEASDLDLLIRNVQVNNVVQMTASFALTEFSSENLVLKPLKHDTLKVEVGFICRDEDLPLPIRSFMNAVLSFYDRKQAF